MSDTEVDTLVVCNTEGMAPSGANPDDWSPPDADPAPEHLQTQAKKRSRGWIFTFNNYTAVDIKRVQHFIETLCVYGNYQHETAPTTGTPHLQGCFFFKNAQTCKGTYRILPGIWVAPSNHPGRTVNYGKMVSKRDHGTALFEVGKPPMQGRRQDLERIAEGIDRGDRMADLAEGRPTQFIRYHRGMQRYRDQVILPRRGDLRVVWLWGERLVPQEYVYKRHLQKDVYEHVQQGLWDGYDGEPIVYCAPNQPWELDKLLQAAGPPSAVVPTGQATVRVVIHTLYVYTLMYPKDWGAAMDGPRAAKSRATIGRFLKVVGEIVKLKTPSFSMTTLETCEEPEDRGGPPPETDLQRVKRLLQLDPDQLELPDDW